MAKEPLSLEEKAKQLDMYRDLNLAAIDYSSEKIGSALPKTDEFDPIEYYEGLKTHVHQYHKKGSLSRLKQWFRDFSEMPLEGRDLNYNRYIKDKTGYEIDIFENFRKRLDKIIEKGKITTDSQYYDINMLINDLCQAEPIDDEKIKVLNKLIVAYETRKVKK